jgi:hypothetical protein
LSEINDHARFRSFVLGKTLSQQTCGTNEQLVAPLQAVMRQRARSRQPGNGDASTPYPRFGRVDADQAAPTSLRYQMDAAAGRTRRKLMRFYFDIRDRLAIRDEVGRDFKLTSDAVLHAKNLAADLRCLERDIRPQLSIQIMSERREHIHAEAVFAYANP